MAIHPRYWVDPKDNAIETYKPPVYKKPEQSDIEEIDYGGGYIVHRIKPEFLPTVKPVEPIKYTVTAETDYGSGYIVHHVVKQVVLDEETKRYNDFNQINAAIQTNTLDSHYNRNQPITGADAIDLYPELAEAINPLLSYNYSQIAHQLSEMWRADADKENAHNRIYNMNEYLTEDQKKEMVDWRYHIKPEQYFQAYLEELKSPNPDYLEIAKKYGTSPYLDSLYELYTKESMASANNPEATALYVAKYMEQDASGEWVYKAQYAANPPAYPWLSAQGVEYYKIIQQISKGYEANVAEAKREQEEKLHMTASWDAQDNSVSSFVDLIPHALGGHLAIADVYESFRYIFEPLFKGHWGILGLNVLNNIIEVLDLPARMTLRPLVKGAIESDSTIWGELTDAWTTSNNTYFDTGNGWADFGLDVITDPLSLLSFGLWGGVKGATKKIVTEVAEGVTKSFLEKTATTIIKDETVQNALQKWSKTMAETLVKDNKVDAYLNGAKSPTLKKNIHALVTYLEQTQKITPDQSIAIRDLLTKNLEDVRFQNMATIVNKRTERMDLVNKIDIGLLKASVPIPYAIGKYGFGKIRSLRALKNSYITPHGTMSLDDYEAFVNNTAQQFVVNKEFLTDGSTPEAIHAAQLANMQYDLDEMRKAVHDFATDGDEAKMQQVFETVAQKRTTYKRASLKMLIKKYERLNVSSRLHAYFTDYVNELKALDSEISRAKTIYQRTSLARVIGIKDISDESVMQLKREDYAKLVNKKKEKMGLAAYAIFRQARMPGVRLVTVGRLAKTIKEPMLKTLDSISQMTLALQNGNNAQRELFDKFMVILGDHFTDGGVKVKLHLGKPVMDIDFTKIDVIELSQALTKMRARGIGKVPMELRNELDLLRQLVDKLEFTVPKKEFIDFLTETRGTDMRPLAPLNREGIEKVFTENQVQQHYLRIFANRTSHNSKYVRQTVLKKQNVLKWAGPKEGAPAAQKGKKLGELEESDNLAAAKDLETELFDIAEQYDLLYQTALKFDEVKNGAPLIYSILCCLRNPIFKGWELRNIPRVNELLQRFPEYEMFFTIADPVGLAQRMFVHLDTICPGIKQELPTLLVRFDNTSYSPVGPRSLCSYLLGNPNSPLAQLDARLKKADNNMDFQKSAENTGREQHKLDETQAQRLTQARHDKGGREFYDGTEFTIHDIAEHRASFYQYYFSKTQQPVQIKPHQGAILVKQERFAIFVEALQDKKFKEVIDSLVKTEALTSTTYSPLQDAYKFLEGFSFHFQKEFIQMLRPICDAMIDYKEMTKAFHAADLTTNELASLDVNAQILASDILSMFEKQGMTDADAIDKVVTQLTVFQNYEVIRELFSIVHEARKYQSLETFMKNISNQASVQNMEMPDEIISSFMDVLMNYNSLSLSEIARPDRIRKILNQVDSQLKTYWMPERFNLDNIRVQLLNENSKLWTELGWNKPGIKTPEELAKLAERKRMIEDICRGGHTDPYQDTLVTELILRLKHPHFYDDMLDGMPTSNGVGIIDIETTDITTTGSMISFAVNVISKRDDLTNADGIIKYIHGKRSKRVTYELRLKDTKVLQTMAEDTSTKVLRMSIKDPAGATADRPDLIKMFVDEHTCPPKKKEITEQDLIRRLYKYRSEHTTIEHNMIDKRFDTNFVRDRAEILKMDDLDQTGWQKIFFNTANSLDFLERELAKQLKDRTCKLTPKQKTLLTEEIQKLPAAEEFAHANSHIFPDSPAQMINRYIRLVRAMNNQRGVGQVSAADKDAAAEWLANYDMIVDDAEVGINATSLSMLQEHYSKNAKYPTAVWTLPHFDPDPVVARKQFEAYIIENFDIEDRADVENLFSLPTAFKGGDENMISPWGYSYIGQRDTIETFFDIDKALAKVGLEQDQTMYLFQWQLMQRFSKNVMERADRRVYNLEPFKGTEEGDIAEMMYDEVIARIGIYKQNERFNHFEFLKRPDQLKHKITVIDYILHSSKLYKTEAERHAFLQDLQSAMEKALGTKKFQDSLMYRTVFLGEQERNAELYARVFKTYETYAERFARKRNEKPRQLTDNALIAAAAVQLRDKRITFEDFLNTIDLTIQKNDYGWRVAQSFGLIEDLYAQIGSMRMPDRVWHAQILEQMKTQNEIDTTINILRHLSKDTEYRILSLACHNNAGIWSIPFHYFDIPDFKPLYDTLTSKTFSKFMTVKDDGETLFIAMNDTAMRVKQFDTKGSIYKILGYDRDIKASTLEAVPYDLSKLDQLGNPELKATYEKLMYQVNLASRGQFDVSLGDAVTKDAMHYYYKHLPDDVTEYAWRLEDILDDKLSKWSGPNFNTFVLGTGAEKKMRHIWSRDNIVDNIEQVITRTALDHQNMNVYLSAYFSAQNSMSVRELLTTMSPEEMKSLFKAHPEMSIAILHSDAKIRHGFKIQGFTYKDLELDKSGKIFDHLVKQNAVMLPTNVLESTMKNINIQELPEGFLRSWSKFVHVLKVGYLTSVGTIARNFVDSALKGMLDAQDPVAYAHNYYKIMSTHMLDEYFTVLKEINRRMKKYSALDITKIDSYFLKAKAVLPAVKIDKKTFQMIHGMQIYAAGGGEAMALINKENLKAAGLRQGKDPLINMKNYNYSDLQRAWERIDDSVKNGWTFEYFYTEVCKRPTSRTAKGGMFSGPTGGRMTTSKNLQKAMTEELAGSRNAMTKIMEQAERGLDLTFSALMHPMCAVETTARLAHYMTLQEQGVLDIDAFYRISKTHFNYDIKSDAVRKMELVMPFYFFEQKNLEFWADSITTHPEALRMMASGYEELIMDPDETELSEIALNPSIQMSKLVGNLPVTKWGMVAKLNPSIMSAFNWFYAPFDKAFNSTLTPIQEVARSSNILKGLHIANLVNENNFWGTNNSLDWTAFTPFANVWTRYYGEMPKRYLDRIPDGVYTPILGMMLSLFPDVVGVTKSYVDVKEASTYDAWIEALNSQGQTYDANSGDVVKMSAREEYGYNSYGSFGQTASLQAMRKGRVWDNNTKAFIPITEWSPTGLNQDYTGRWDDLTADMWRYAGLVWDGNVRKFVEPYKKTDGGLNDPDLSWDDVVRLHEEILGLLWDSNQSKFVYPDEYTGDIMLNRTDLTWDEVCAYKAQLFNEEWDSNLKAWVALGTSTSDTQEDNYTQRYFSNVADGIVYKASSMEPVGIPKIEGRRYSGTKQKKPILYGQALKQYYTPNTYTKSAKLYYPTTHVQYSRQLRGVISKKYRKSPAWRSQLSATEKLRYGYL